MLNGNGTAPKVVVVGGSLGGLFNALALRSLGCEVEVFEKSSGLMRDRGAGIVFQQEVAEFRFDAGLRCGVGDRLVGRHGEVDARWDFGDRAAGERWQRPPGDDLNGILRHEARSVEPTSATRSVR